MADYTSKLAVLLLSEMLVITEGIKDPYQNNGSICRPIIYMKSNLSKQNKYSNTLFQHKAGTGRVNDTEMYAVSVHQSLASPSFDPWITSPFKCLALQT